MLNQNGLATACVRSKQHELLPSYSYLPAIQSTTETSTSKSMQAAMAQSNILTKIAIEGLLQYQWGKPMSEAISQMTIKTWIQFYSAEKTPQIP